MKNLVLLLLFSCSLSYGQQKPLKIFISVDMEGIGGIGTPKMVSSSGKDYALGRKLMTAEVNAVVEAIFEQGDAEILVNDSHGDMQNLLHVELDPRVEYLQSNIKPLGMVQGLDASFDAVIFIGYHTRAGTENGFLSHTGSGSVKGLWINGTEVGEGGLNAHFAGALGVPVILASGDKAFAEQIQELFPIKTVSTKEAVGSSAARMIHPEKVRELLKAQTKAALRGLSKAKPLTVKEPTTFRIKLASPTHADVVMSIPGMKRIDGFTIEYEAESMDSAYRMIRIIYKYIKW
ncbi:MAG: M55 family metallopeptidase [Roseivirga sp.]|nr:M55 family metallopeptidase [Roseivirga sp.]